MIFLFRWIQSDTTATTEKKKSQQTYQMMMDGFRFVYKTWQVSLDFFFFLLFLSIFLFVFRNDCLHEHRKTFLMIEQPDPALFVFINSQNAAHAMQIFIKFCLNCAPLVTVSIISFHAVNVKHFYCFDSTPISMRFKWLFYDFVEN